MARPLRIEYEGAFYHIVQRGIERRDIFISASDKEKFLSYLEFAHSCYGAAFHSYILMNNHYHLILETPRANLSKIMHYINASYAAYYNAKRKRTGPLYQGRYKAILVQKDEYLHHLSRYIHLNALRARIVKDPKDYPWSSYNYFVSSGHNAPAWLNTYLILRMFNNNIPNAKRLYKDFVMDGIGAEGDCIKENIINGVILGSAEFAEDIINRFIHIDEHPEIPAIKGLKQRNVPSLERIKEAVEETVISDKRLQRKFCLYLSRKYAQKTLTQIAAFYGKIRDTGVSQAFVRTERTRQEDKDIGSILSRIEKKINV